MMVLDDASDMAVQFSVSPVKFGFALKRSLAVALLAGLAGAAGAQSLTPSALFDWAERQYPTLFPGHAADQTLDVFTLRAYPATQTYLGAADGVAYVLGPISGNQLLAVDTVAGFRCMAASCATPEIAAARLHYGQTAVFTVSADALGANASYEFAVDKCTNLQRVAAVDARVRNISCRVNGTGTLTAEARDGAGNVLVRKAFEVPQPQVRIETSLGNVQVQLNPGAAPITVNNFLDYVNTGFYTGTLFHRVIAGFVAQGGGFTTGMQLKGSSKAPITLESNNGLSNARGSIAMARAVDPNSATSQFYVNLVDNPGLNYSAASPGYAVFGSVVGGMDVVDRMATVPTATVGGLPNVPQPEILIQRAVQTQ